MIKNIILIGMTGCGKTTIGQKLSQEIDYDFYDMDNYIEEITNKTIPELFKESEDIFRKWETKACIELSKKEKSIISTGGGVIKKDENIQALKENSNIFFIDRPLNHISKDIDITTRPLLANDPEALQQLFIERYPIYTAVADYTIPNAGDIDRVIQTIKEIIQN